MVFSWQSASTRTGERHVLFLYPHMRVLFLMRRLLCHCVENSVQESVLNQNPNLLSGKDYEEKHGFGMETIYMLVEKYHGEYNCWEEENRFIQEIYLKHNV